MNNTGYRTELAGLGIHEFVSKKLVRVSDINASA